MIHFIPIFLTLHSYPYCFETKPRSTPTPSTAPNTVKEDNFALANIPILFLELCEYTLILYYIAATFQYQYEQEINRIWTAS